MILPMLGKPYASLNAWEGTYQLILGLELAEESSIRQVCSLEGPVFKDGKGIPVFLINNVVDNPF